MFIRTSYLVFALSCAAWGVIQNSASAANLAGIWDVSVDDGQSGTIDFPVTVTQNIVFLSVSEERTSGTVTGSGISPGPLVLWIDSANSIFLGRADNPRNPSSIDGLIVVNFESLTFSTWSASKQAP